MKNEKFLVMIALVALLTACNVRTATPKDDTDDTAGVETEASTTGDAYCKQLIEYGAADACIDHAQGILYVGFTAGQVAAHADDVAKLWYEDAVSSGVKGLTECRLMELPAGKMVGRYKKR
jgi:hypothetical protein